MAQDAQQFAESLGILPSRSGIPSSILYTVTTLTALSPEAALGIDRLDARLIELLAEEPRIGVLEASRRLGVARGTAQARLDRLLTQGVIRGFGPEVDPAAIGYPVTAFATLEIKQGQGPDVRSHLAGVPEVLELHTTTGHGDMLCRLVARSNADLQRVIDRVVGFEGIVRASTTIVMENPVPLRMIPLVKQAAED